jgi:hypothetical protein
MNKIDVRNSGIFVTVGIFRITQDKSLRTLKWEQPTINHSTSGSYDINGLLLHEFDMMKAKNIARILLMHFKNQDTPNAYTLESVESQIKAVLGEY